MSLGRLFIKIKCLKIYSITTIIIKNIEDTNIKNHAFFRVFLINKQASKQASKQANKM